MVEKRCIIVSMWYILAGRTCRCHGRSDVVGSHKRQRALQQRLAEFEAAAVALDGMRGRERTKALQVLELALLSMTGPLDGSAMTWVRPQHLEPARRDDRR
jgi:hypothetical protein